MDVQPARPAVDHVFFELAGVVRDVVEQCEVCAEELGEHPARQVGQDLPVGLGAVDAGAHGTEVGLAEGGVDRRAGKRSIRERNTVLCRRDGHALQVIGADLMAETPRPAMDTDHGSDRP
jgi:hypothetical protein